MRSDSRPALWWVRRDFRLADNPAVLSAIDDGDAVAALFVLDPALLAKAGKARGAWLAAALHALDHDLVQAGGAGLSVMRGRPQEVVARVARDLGVARVHIATDFGPYGRARDERVERALAIHGIDLARAGSPYAVAPGRLKNGSGQPYQVFSPFHRAWQALGVHDPAPDARSTTAHWIAVDGRVELEKPDAELAAAAGEGPARAAWNDWLHAEPGGVGDYDRLHDFPGADATSHLSIALRWGHLHPRTILADLKTIRSPGAAALARQIAWRDFFADVLLHRPDAVSQPIRTEFAAMATEEPEPDTLAAERLDAWQQGRTGYPLVDAGMRQLLAEGWMHNRVRMVVASFLVKDLHLGWWHGAEWFMAHLRDGDIAQNQLNWQWVAGCGTDAAPYFRVFNPTSQAVKFDSDGGYIRRYVPELAQVPLEHLHQPWKTPRGVPEGYVAPIVDHAEERTEALERYAAIRR